MEYNADAITKSLDAKGLCCPLPLLKTKLALREMAIGECLKVAATDAGAKRDIPDFVIKSGHHLLKATEKGNVYYFWIRKGN